VDDRDLRIRLGLQAQFVRGVEGGRATREAVLARIPLGRLAEPDDLTGALLFMLSDASAFLTGQVLYLDGGYTAC
jgi:NAD(P)-dependent dehydrogenase (short-subunit alcohol dehydrogenase family)